MPILNLFCNDPKNFMNPHGYGTIAVPRASIQPLQMLSKSGGRLTPIGPLSGTFQAGAAPLPVPKPFNAVNLSGAQARNIDVSIGLDILGKVIGALAGSTLGIKAAYKQAKKVSFEFGEVTERAVEISDLDQFLSAASVAGNAGNFLKALLEEDEVYCIISTVEARQINVEASAEGSGSLGLEIPVIQQLVGGKVSVSGGSSSSSKLTYTSNDTPLAFGLKVVRLFVKDGRYTTMKLVKAKNANTAAAILNDDGAGDDDTAVFAVDIEG
ncbi:MAG: hypothetical protein ABWX67_13005 [Allosphingosinicella sp.]